MKLPEGAVRRDRSRSRLRLDSRARARREVVDERRFRGRVGEQHHLLAAPGERDVEHAPLLFDVVGEAVGHQPVVRAEHDHPVPLEPLHPVHGRERDLPGRAGIVADRHALEVLAQPQLERRRIRVHGRDRDERGEVVEVRCVAAAARVVERAHRGAEPDVVANGAQHGRGVAGRDLGGEAVEVVGELVDAVGVGRVERVGVGAQRGERPAPVANRVDDAGGDAPVRAADDLGQVGAAQLVAVGNRAREPEVRERAAHTGAPQEVLADGRGDRQAAVVREHLHREQPGVDAAQHRDLLGRDAGREPFLEEVGGVRRDGFGRSPRDLERVGRSPRSARGRRA